MDKTFISVGHDAVLMFNGTVTVVFVELHLAGGSGFTLVEECAKVLDRHTGFLSAENHIHKWSFHNQVYDKWSSL